MLLTGGFISAYIIDSLSLPRLLIVNILNHPTENFGKKVEIKWWYDKNWNC